MNQAVAELPETPRSSRDQGCARWVLVGVVLGLVLCLASCTLVGIAVAANGRAAGGPIRLGGGGIIVVCAGVVTQPYVQMGVGWQAMMMSVMPPPVTYAPYAVCVDVPQWPVPFPLRGEWMFPP